MNKLLDRKIQLWCGIIAIACGCITTALTGEIFWSIVGVASLLQAFANRLFV